MINSIARMQGLLACSMGSVAFAAAARVVMEDTVETYFRELEPVAAPRPVPAAKPVKPVKQLKVLTPPLLSESDLKKIDDLFGGN